MGQEPTQLSTSTSAPDEQAELRQQIAEQRESLGADLTALGDHVSPARMVERRRATVGQRWRDVRDRVMGVADSAGSSAGSVRGTVSDAVGSVTQSVAGTPEAARQATQGSPLAVGLIGFGAGLVAAALLPTSEREQELAHKVEPAAQRAAEQAGSVVRQEVDELAPEVKSAAQEVADRAREAGAAIKDEAKGAADQVRDEAEQASGASPQQSS